MLSARGVYRLVSGRPRPRVMTSYYEPRNETRKKKTQVKNKTKMVYVGLEEKYDMRIF